MTESACKELANITEWMRVNKLINSLQKTELVIIGHPISTRKTELTEKLELNGSARKRVGKPKYIGIIVEESFWLQELNAA